MTCILGVLAAEVLPVPLFYVSLWWFYFVFKLVSGAGLCMVTRNYQCMTHTYFIFLFQPICFIPQNMICSW